MSDEAADKEGRYESDEKKLLLYSKVVNEASGTPLACSLSKLMTPSDSRQLVAS